MTLYAGETVRIVHTATDETGELTASDVAGVLVSIFDPNEDEVQAETSMTWDDARSRWEYAWTSGDAGTYRVKCRIIGVDGGSAWEWKPVRLVANPI